jgi:hypothetical protein
MMAILRIVWLTSAFFLELTGASEAVEIGDEGRSNLLPRFAG